MRVHISLWVIRIMKVFRLYLALIVVLAGAANLWADISPGLSEPKAPSVSSNNFGASKGIVLNLSDSNQAVLPAIPGNPTQDKSILDSLSSRFPSTGYVDGSILETEAKPTVVYELPPPPDNVMLALSGLLSIGAFNLARSYKKLGIGVLPEWYHDAGPAQISHAVPFDLDFSYLPLCCFETPHSGVDERPFLSYLQREQTSRFRSHYFIPVTAPRSPPAGPV